MPIGDTERGRILWVDDEIELLKPHILFLEERHFEVLPVHSGEDAIQAISENTFDVVLLDEMMHGMDGLSTLQAIKELNPGQPVIMITKNEEEWLMNEAIAADISGYLTKPVNPSQILMACKSVLEKSRIRSDDAASRYLKMFQELGDRINDVTSLDDWIGIFQDLTSWDVEFDEHPALHLNDLLAEQHLAANNRFSQFVEDHYPQWLQSEDVVLSHRVIETFVAPHLKAGKRVIFIVLDCLRLDQWKAMRLRLQDRFHIKDAVHVSLLPTATPFSRNAIFGGKTPGQLQAKYPVKWRDMWASETSMNLYEGEFLGDHLKQLGLGEIQFKYFKLPTAVEGRRLLSRMAEYQNVRMMALVVNFIDLLAHHRAESDVIKEILPDESGYRTTICSWLDNSWMRDFLRTASEWDDTVFVLTSDHGSIMVDKPVRVPGDRDTSSGVRYKYGRNLSTPSKGGLVIKKPADFELPAQDVSTNYIIAKDRNYFVFPSEYHKFVRRFENSFQHGGISLEEMIVPVATLTPKRG